MLTSRTRTSVLLFALASPLSAQVGQVELACRALGGDFFPLVAGAFTETAELELNRDFRADVALLVGDTPVISFSPGIYEALKSLPVTAVDLVPLRGRGLHGADALLLTSTRPALEQWSLDLDTATFEMTELCPSGWTGVTELAAADLDGNGLEDVLGVTPDRQSVIYLLAPLAVPQLVGLGETLWRLTPIEWDGTSGMEIGLITSAGIRVIERTGEPRFFVPTYGGQYNRFCAVDTGAAYDRLSSLVRMTDGTYNLFTADKADWDPLTFMGAFTPVAIVAGKFDLDGLGDVCISHKTTGQLVYFENQLDDAAQSFAWTGGTYALWDPTSDGTGAAPAPENEAHPLLCDLDQDGDGDVAFPVQEEEALMLLRNRARNHQDRAPTVASALYAYSEATQSGTLALTLAGPLFPPREDDKLRIVVWRQASLSHYADVETNAIYTALPDVTEWPMTVSIPLQEPFESPTLFHIELRLADWANGAITSCAATAVWTFTTSEASKNDMIALYDVAPEDILEVPLDDGEEGTELLAGTGGWTGPMPCIPCFSDEEIPAPGN